MSEQVSIEEYHASERISSSKLRTFMALGPRAYYLRHVLKSNVLKASKPMIVGQAFEDAICGRETFKVIEGDGRTKLVKQQKAEAEAEGKLVITGEHADFMRFGVENVRANPAAMELIEGAFEQPTMYADFDGLPGLQARPDWGTPSGRFPDLKTTGNLDKFSRSVVDFGYHMQAGIVRMCARASGMPETDHPLIVVERDWPYRCQVMRLSDEYVELGVAEATKHLNRMADCFTSGEWQFCDAERLLEPPKWLLERNETK